MPLDLRQLRDRPLAGVVLHDADDRARADVAIRLRIGRQRARREAQVVALDRRIAAVDERDRDLARAGGRDDRGDQFAVVGVFEQRIVDRLFAVVGAGRQLDEAFRPR